MLHVRLLDATDINDIILLIRIRGIQNVLQSLRSQFVFIESTIHRLILLLPPLQVEWI